MATTSDERDFGKRLQYDPNFKGPLKHRSCTDVICLLLFILFLCVWGCVAYFAYHNGDPGKFISPRDSDGHICGRDDMRDKTKTFYFDLTQCLDLSVVYDGCKTPQVCVKECPKTNWAATEVLTQKEPIDWKSIRSQLICRNDSITATVKSLATFKQVIEKNLCAKYYIAMTSFYNRCIPSLADVSEAKKVLEENHISLSQITNATKIIGFLTSIQNVNEVVFEECYKIRYYLYGGLGLAMVFSLVYIVLLRYISYVVVWVSILFSFVLVGYGSYYSYVKYKSIPDKNQSEEVGEHFDLILKIRDTHFIQDQYNSFVSDKQTWLYLLILSSSIFIVLLLVVLFLRSRIKIAIALIDAASKCVYSIKSSLFFPVFPWSLHLIVILWSLVVGIYLYSLGDSTYMVSGLASDNQCKCMNNYYSYDGQWCIPDKWKQMCHKINTNDHSCPLAACSIHTKNPNNFATYLFLFNIFAYFWSSSFVSALSEMILASTFASWYWSFHKKDLTFFTLTSAFFRTIRYHLGTAAFGSLIISICKFIRFLLEYVERKCKKFDNGFTRAILWTLRCFFWCLHKFIAFVNRNAYIMCAIYGGNFCKSAKDAFSLLIRNVVRVAVVDKVSDLLLFLGKILITAGMSFAAYYIFICPVQDFDTKQFFTLQHPWAPTAILGVATFLISSTFFHVYSMAIDTLFLCFLEDCERNDGSTERPYYLPNSLMKVLGKKNVDS